MRVSSTEHVLHLTGGSARAILPHLRVLHLTDLTTGKAVGPLHGGSERGEKHSLPGPLGGTQATISRMDDGPSGETVRRVHRLPTGALLTLPNSVDFLGDHAGELHDLLLRVLVGLRLGAVLLHWSYRPRSPSSYFYFSWSLSTERVRIYSGFETGAARETATLPGGRSAGQARTIIVGLSIGIVTRIRGRVRDENLETTWRRFRHGGPSRHPSGTGTFPRRGQGSGGR
ncbi:hypothetical protein PG985_012435 [Apiospora marii]|uniref:Uncharacterized protein n=1 Tax=Apiospora marii TaxID=335849 RepID=A0ABR1RDE5_9PEZI